MRRNVSRARSFLRRIGVLGLLLAVIMDELEDAVLNGSHEGSILLFAFAVLGRELELGRDISRHNVNSMGV
jgi:hypothetical protein